MPLYNQALQWWRMTCMHRHVAEQLGQKYEQACEAVYGGSPVATGECICCSALCPVLLMQLSCLVPVLWEPLPAP